MGLQQAARFVCEKEIYEIDPPEKKQETYRNRTEGVEEVVVLSGDGSQPEKTSSALEGKKASVWDALKAVEL